MLGPVERPVRRAEHAATDGQRHRHQRLLLERREVRRARVVSDDLLERLADHRLPGPAGVGDCGPRVERDRPPPIELLVPVAARRDEVQLIAGGDIENTRRRPQLRLGHVDDGEPDLGEVVGGVQRRGDSSGPPQLCGLPALPIERLEVVDGESCQASDGLGQLDVVRPERPAAVDHCGGEDPPVLGASEQRRQDGTSQAERAGAERILEWSEQLHVLGVVDVEHERSVVGHHLAHRMVGDVRYGHSLPGGHGARTSGDAAQRAVVVGHHDFTAVAERRRQAADERSHRFTHGGGGSQRRAHLTNQDGPLVQPAHRMIRAARAAIQRLRARGARRRSERAR